MAALCQTTTSRRTWDLAIEPNNQIHKKSRWWFQIFFMFTPYLGKCSNLTSIYFSNGLVQPPTRKMMEQKSRNRPCTLSCAFVVDIAKFHVVPPRAPGVRKLLYRMPTVYPIGFPKKDLGFIVKRYKMPRFLF